MVKCYTRPHEAVTYIEKKILPKAYREMDVFDREKLQHYFYVELLKDRLQTF